MMVPLYQRLIFEKNKFPLFIVSSNFKDIYCQLLLLFFSHILTRFLINPTIVKYIYIYKLKWLFFIRPCVNKYTSYLQY